jgi:hypothetical protein
MPLHQKFRLLQSAAAVKRQYRKGWLSQLVEIARLRLGSMRLGAGEYYYYRLFEDSVYTRSAKAEFGGQRFISRLYRELNSIAWDAVLTDKLVFYAVASSLGLPHPSIKAIAGSRRRNHGSVPCFSPVKEVAGFLRNGISYPFFVKPVKSWVGRGAVAVMQYDPVEDVVMQGNGVKRSLDTFVEELSDPEGSGLMFLELLCPNPITAELGVMAVSSVRMNVLLYEHGPELAHAVWKIPVGSNMTDNFVGGRTGNIAARIDLETGSVDRVISGVGLNQELLESHPETGMRMLGFALPNWSAAVDLCMSAAAAFPAVQWQNWDIALTSRGPVILELNTAGGIDLLQTACASGILDERLKRFLQDYKIEQPEIF